MSKNPVTRRQFLSYTLTGVGGFMAAGMMLPMLRFAVDPVLKAEAGGDFKMTNKKLPILRQIRCVLIFNMNKKMHGTLQKLPNTLGFTKMKQVKLLRFHRFVNI